MPLTPFVTIALGDVACLQADVVVLPTDRDGPRSPIRGKLTAAVRALPGFDAACDDALEGYRNRTGRSARDGIALGDAVFVPLPDLSGPRGIVVVNAVAEVWKPDAVVAAAEQAAHNAVREALAALPGVARPLVALPGIATGTGGGSGLLASVARAQIAGAHRAAADRGADADIAFVLYDPVVYRAFVVARDALGLTPVLSVEERDHVKTIAAAIRGDSCALFVGSGLSVGAGLAGYHDLIARLVRDLKAAGATGLDSLDLNSVDVCLEVAQWYRVRFPDDHDARIRQILAELFDRPEVRPTLAHYLLLALPIRKIVTTNYDQLLEDTLERLLRHPVQVVDRGHVPQTAEPDLTCVVKLHGDVRESDQDDALAGGLVLSADDYDSFFERRPVMAALLEALLLNHTFFFVGYSLRDPNFRSVFHRIDTLLKEVHRPAFATIFGEASPMARDLWAGKGLHLMPMGSADPRRRLLAVLDALCAATVGETAPLLHPDPPSAPSPAFAPVGEQLAALGERLLRIDPSRMEADEARLCADALRLVTAGGWKRAETVPVWERLLSRLADGHADAYLPAALACAGSREEAARLRRAAGVAQKGRG